MNRNRTGRVVTERYNGDDDDITGYLKIIRRTRRERVRMGEYEVNMMGRL